MTAFDADLWARKIVQALAQEGIFLTEETNDMGLFDLAGHSIAILGQISNQKASQEAYDRLLQCVHIQRDPRKPEVQPAPLLDIDIQDPTTLPALRLEAFRFHVDFLQAVAFQTFLPAAARIPEAQENKRSSL